MTGYGPHVFLYVTDEGLPHSGEGIVKQSRRVVDPAAHPALMGTICAELRAMRMQASDAEAFAAGAAGVSLP